jgi:hypothetical protein
MQPGKCPLGQIGLSRDYCSQVRSKVLDSSSHRRGSSGRSEGVVTEQRAGGLIRQPVYPQLRKWPVRYGTYASCQLRK